MSRLASTLAAFAIVAATAAGCGAPLEVTHVRTGPPLASKPPGVALPVYFNQQPERPYREIAQIRVRSRGSAANLDAVLGAATADARALGADALLVDVRAHYQSIEVTVDCDGRPRVPPSDRLNARVTAIVFTAEQAASPEAAPAGPSPRRLSGCPGGP